MTFYIVIYLIILLTSIFHHVVRKNKNKEIIYFISIFLILFFFSAFRASTVGSDTSNYINLFNNISASKMVDSSKHFELGYQYFNLVLSFITKNPQSILVVTSFINILVYMIFFKKTSYAFAITMILYTTSREYFSGYNIIRQTLASSILLFSYFKLKDDKNISFILLTLIASTIHQSALIFLLILPVKYIKSNQLLKFIIVFSIGILLIPTEYIFKIPFYSSYFGGKYDNSLKVGSILSLILYGLTLIIYYFSNNKVNKNDKLILNIVLIGLLIEIIAVKTSIAGRLGVYFVPFSLVLLTNSIMSIKIKANRFAVLFAVLTIYSMSYFVIQILRPEWNRIIPYEFFW